MTIDVLIDEAIQKFETEHGVAPNVIFIGRLQVAALRALVPAFIGGPVPGEAAIRRPNYDDIAIAEVDADSHLSVDRLAGNEWPSSM